MNKTELVAAMAKETSTVDLDLETAPKLLRLIDMLEDCDDVQNVYHNGEISDEVAAQL